MGDPTDVLLDEARRKYDMQVDRLAGFRSGTATLLAAGSIVSGLFGVKIGGHVPAARTTLVVLALVSFVALVGFSLLVLKPHKNYDEGEKLGGWIESIRTHDVREATFVLNLAFATNDAYRNNARFVAGAARNYRWVCVALAVEVICWCLTAVG